MKRVTLLSTYSRLLGQVLSSHDTPRHLRPIYGNLRLEESPCKNAKKTFASDAIFRYVMHSIDRTT